MRRLSVAMGALVQIGLLVALGLPICAATSPLITVIEHLTLTTIRLIFVEARISILFKSNTIRKQCHLFLFTPGLWSRI